MSTRQQQYQGFSANSNTRQSVDVAAWALVALVVAIVCAAAGWAIARQGTPGQDELVRSQALAARDGAAQGMNDGYSRGARAGRQSAALRARLQAAQAKQRATQEGYSAGFSEGQSRAAARSGDGFGYVPSAGSAYPSADWSDVLASGAFDDVPGYSDSAYSSSGLGSGTATPYAYSGSASATAYGDRY